MRLLEPRLHTMRLLSRWLGMAGCWGIVPGNVTCIDPGGIYPRTPGPAAPRPLGPTPLLTGLTRITGRDRAVQVDHTLGRKAGQSMSVKMLVMPSGIPIISPVIIILTAGLLEVDGSLLVPLLIAANESCMPHASNRFHGSPPQRVPFGPAEWPNSA